ncbi:MAG: GTP cyclohydrolase I FolE2 [Candidatus Aenigmarchaeota archaeon]|nr:GTP cyclohydrolase I FolE2 [Candidatus Aenigmarchaeota archaeon]
MIDVQNSVPANPLELSRVGVENVKKLIIVGSDSDAYQCVMSIDAYVTLPAHQRGAHMSRFIESIHNLSSNMHSIEDVAETLAKSILEKHHYHCETKVSGIMPFHKRNVSGGKETAIVNVCATYDTRTKQRTIELSLKGILACPCSKELTGGLTHNQRGELQLRLDTTGAPINHAYLIDICNSCFSSPTYSLLKRPQEKSVVEKIHQNPMFVEDVVRKCAAELKAEYPRRQCHIKCISFESIHDHNISSQWEGTL